MIELRNLTKIYGTLTAVDNVSLTIDPGTIFGFVGPNGAGKTTTILFCVRFSADFSFSNELFRNGSCLFVYSDFK